MALAERQLKLGHRSGRGMLLILVDVDGLKQINDSLGHSQGDSALRRTADVLRKTFRNSDVIARMLFCGGDSPDDTCCSEARGGNLVPIDPSSLSARYYQPDELHLNSEGAMLFTSALATALPKTVAQESALSPH